VSATESGNLLTPLLLGSVVGSIAGGQIISRTGKYRNLALTGSVLIAIGTIMYARMGADTLRTYVAVAMVLAGVGMGFIQPVYNLAVQNVAPRNRMGAATSVPTFFRSIGSTVGVAAFGSVMLTQYHSEFMQSVPTGVPPAALQYFENPLLLVQVRPQLDQIFSTLPGGQQLLVTLLQSVKTGLMHGIQEIFFWSAVLTCFSVVLHLFLRDVPMRGKAPASQPQSSDAAAAAALH
jgi:MFS family permease